MMDVCHRMFVNKYLRLISMNRMLDNDNIDAKNDAIECWNAMVDLADTFVSKGLAHSIDELQSALKSYLLDTRTIEINGWMFAHNITRNIDIVHTWPSYFDKILVIVLRGCVSKRAVSKKRFF